MWKRKKNKVFSGPETGVCRFDFSRSQLLSVGTLAFQGSQPEETPWGCLLDRVRSDETLGTARCVSRTLKECVVSHTLTKIFVCGTLEFSKSLTEMLRNGCGTIRAADATRQSPISPQMFLQTGVGRASTHHLSQPPVGGLGTATVQPPPSSSHTHFSEYQWAIFEHSSVPHTNFFVSVWYPTHSLSCWKRNALM